MTRPAALAQVIFLAAWLGAVVFFGAFVAPAAFASLPTRSLAGAVVGRILPALFVAGMGVGVLLAVTSLVGHKALGRAVLGGALVMSCAISHLVVGAGISSLREVIGPSLDALSPDDPRRATFGQLHALSVAGLGVGTLAAVLALWLAVAAVRRDDYRRTV